MSFSVGIVGFPNVGKSTLFTALTKKKVDIAQYPFTTIHPNYGIVLVPDKRLEEIGKIIKPEKITPTTIEFVDIAGLVKGAHQGEGLGNQFLAQIRNCDAILVVLRGFQDAKVENVFGQINPEKEFEVLKTELLMKDLESLEKILLKVETDFKRDKKVGKKAELLKKIKNFISQGKAILEIDLTEEEKKEIKDYQFLSQKPIVYLINVNSEKEKNFNNLSFKSLTINLKEEKEMLELTEKEIEELKIKPSLDQVIINCYNVLDLITFFTVAGGKEAKAWTLKRGLDVKEAGGIVHTDFKEKFIKAEVINWQDLIKAGGWKKARELGLLKVHGKEYIVQDGDVIEFKI